MDKAIIYQYIDNVIKQPIYTIGRALNMLYIGFGKERGIIDWMESDAYDLQIQTMWRIVNKEKKEILLASTDIYLPQIDAGPAKEFDLKEPGGTLFDEKSIKWLDHAKPVYVKEFKVNEWGDLFLIFSNDDRLEVFVDASDDTECWRLFKAGYDKRHLVVRGSGVSFE